MIGNLEAKVAGTQLVSLTLQTTLLACASLVADSALANTGVVLPELTLPTDGEVVQGEAAIDQRVGELNVIQTTQRAVIDWQTFNVGKDAAVNFLQPNTEAAILNRVLDTQPSQILGQLNANGQVFITNPQGILFSESAQVDVGGLVASTLALDPNDFMAGQDTFRSAGEQGSVIQNGRIDADTLVALLGNDIRNNGLIRARLGSILLAGAPKLTLSTQDSGLIDVVVDLADMQTLISEGQAIVSSTGEMVMSQQAAQQIRAGTINSAEDIGSNTLVQRDGRVFIEPNRSVVQQGDVIADGGLIHVVSENSYFGEGLTQAREGGEIIVESSALLESVSRHQFDVAGEQGGRILLDSGAEGSLVTSATFNAQGEQGAGGEVSITGAEVALLGAQINADGVTHGGVINIGGEWQGSGDLRQAEKVVVNAVAELSAQGATEQGGSIAVWSTEYTGFLGQANTVGGVENPGADLGGQIEVSSKGRLDFDGDLQAGLGGLVLFDPANLTISNASGSALTWRREESAFTLGLTTIGGDENDLGQSVAIEGTLLAIGHSSQDNQRGSVYLYTGADSANFSSLVFERRLGQVTGATGQPFLPLGEFFGESVAIDNGRLAVGATQLSSNVGRGAVYLYDGVGADFSTLNYVTTISSGAGAIGMPTLDNIEYFGSSLDLDGDRLVVGAYNDSSAGAFRGEVYLFSGLNTASFSGLTYQNSIVSGATSVAAGMPTLSDSDFFGRSVSLDGGLLAVGASGDDTGGTDRGAVHLFSGFSTADGTDFSGLTWQGKITSGDTAVAVGMPDIEDSDEFGYAIELNGGRLAVGAPGSDFGNSTAGSLYVFSGTGTDFSGLMFDTLVRSGEGATGQPVLTPNEAVGRAVALDGDSLVLGGQNSVHFFDLGITVPVSVGDGTFATTPGDDSTITPASITALLDAGTDVTLQANNDILVARDVITNNPGGAGGALTLQAGRSITVRSDIVTDDGNLTLTANAPAASGVVDAFRSAGAADLTIEDGASINAGAGTLTLEISDGAGNTNNASGTLILRDVSADTILAVNNPVNTTGELQVFGTLSASGSGNALSLAAGEIHLDPGASVTAANGRWLIYSQTPVNDTIDTLSSGNAAVWGRTYAGYGPGSVVEGGNRYVFAVPGDVTLTTDNLNKVYGTVATLTGTYTGLPFDGASYGNAYNDSTPAQIFSTQPLITSTGNVVNASVAGSTYPVLASGGVVNTGYSITYANAGTLNVTPAPLTISAQADTRDYNGTTASSVLPSITGLVSGDTVTGLQQTFDNANAGARLLSVTGFTVNDGNGGTNYTVSTNTIAGQIDPLTLTILGSTAADRVYDGTAAASVTPGTLNGLVGLETLTISGVTATFADEHAGVGRTVTATYTLADGTNGGLASNYTLPNENLLATITPAPLSLVTTGGEIRVYDGTLNSALIPTSVGLIAGDTLTGLSQRYLSANAGVQNLEITPGYVLNDGNGGANYAITTVVNTGQITPAPLTYVNLAAINKVYDGTTTASVSFDSVSGLVGSEMPGGMPIATFADANVGSGISVSFNPNLSDGGNGFLAANYSASPAVLMADITPASLILSATNEVKVYDAMAVAFEVPTVAGLVSGDTVTGLAQGFAGANAGAQATSVTSYTVNDGNGGGNYTVSLVDGMGTVTPAPLTIVGGEAQNRVYDGTVAATVSVGTLSGLVGTETLNLTGTATFADPNVADGINVSVVYSLADGTNGGLAANYAVTASPLLTANITPASLVLTAASDVKIYDATTTSDGLVSAAGLVGSDSVTNLSQVFDSANVGSRSLQVASFSVVDGNAGNNYLVTTVDATGSITSAELIISAVSDTRDYDGTLNSVGMPTAAGLLGTDQLASVSQAFDAATAGDRTLSVNQFTIADGNGGSNYSVLLQNAIGEIVPIPLVVTANDVELEQSGFAFFGGDGVTFDGFIAGESVTDLNGSLAFSGDSQGAILEGSYDLIPVGFSSPNYVIDFVAGQLNILPAPLLSGEPQPLPPLFGTQPPEPAQSNGEVPLELQRACAQGSSLMGANVCVRSGVGSGISGGGQ